MRSLSIRPTSEESHWGWRYLLLELLVLPLLLTGINAKLPQPLPPAVLNIISYIVNFVCIVLIFRRFLWKSLQNTIKQPFYCLQSAGIGLILYYGSSFLLSLGTFYLLPEFENVNDQNLTGMLQQYTLPMQICTVFLVPLSEEVLFRGLIFQGLYPRHKFAAYAISSAAFAAIHVVGYLGAFPLDVLALCFVQYLPAGIALAYAYARSDSIWAPILMHMTINQISIAVLR